MPTIIGKEIHSLAQILWPVIRSITGDSVRKTLTILKSDGTKSLIDIADIYRTNNWDIFLIYRKLKDENLMMEA